MNRPAAPIPIAQTVERERDLIHRQSSDHLCAEDIIQPRWSDHRNIPLRRRWQ